MRFGISGTALLILACSDGAGTPELPPGSQLVLEFAQAWGVAWPPAWCVPAQPSAQACLRRLPDGSEAVLYWSDRREPYSVTRTWSVSPIRGVDLRDSLRQALVGRGARRLPDMIGPEDTVHHAHIVAMRWCLDSAIVTVVRSWQEGHRQEGTNMAIGAVVPGGCARLITARRGAKPWLSHWGRGRDGH